MEDLWGLGTPGTSDALHSILSALLGTCLSFSLTSHPPFNPTIPLEHLETGLPGPGVPVATYGLGGLPHYSEGSRHNIYTSHLWFSPLETGMGSFK